MAIIANTFLTYSAIGNREDLSNTIYNISPEDTPFINNIGRDKAAATLFEWQTDALAAAAANAQFQGDDVTTFGSVTPTARIGNRTMISRKTVIVSGTQDAVDKAGRKKETAYQMAKKSAELKRDMEYNLIGLNLAGVTGDSTTAPVTATFSAFIKTNVDMGTAGSPANPDYTSGVPNKPRTDGTVRALTETILKNVLQLCWVSGGTPEVFMVGPINKQRISGFTGIATRFRDVSSNKPAQIIGAADVYVSDFGSISIVPNRFQRERDGWAISPDYAAVAYLRPFQTKELATTGDADKRMIIVEYGLKVMNEAAHGLAADLQTT